MNGNMIPVESRVETKIIGGMFGLEETRGLHSCIPPFLEGQTILLVNARSGIFLLIELLSPSHVWLPSYLCGVMLETVNKSSANVRFYEVNYDLAVPSLEWLSDVQQGDLVILMDYFGFPCDSSCAAQAKERGAWVLEDACQALLSGEVGRFSDFVLFSPRKFLGVPDGGILTCRRKIDLNGIDLRNPPAEWWLKAFFSTVLRREFDIHGGNRRWFELFRQVDIGGPIGHYAMSEISNMLLRRGFDYSGIAQRRIDNYAMLNDELHDIAVFPSLSSNTVPLGFPIRLENRDRLRQVLFDHEIYPPVHWPIQDVVPQEFRDSHRLAKDIMTLPCDQRYDTHDMKRMAKVVLEELK